MIFSILAIGAPKFYFYEKVSNEKRKKSFSAYFVNPIDFCVLARFALFHRTYPNRQDYHHHTATAGITYPQPSSANSHAPSSRA